MQCGYLMYKTKADFSLGLKNTFCMRIDLVLIRPRSDLKPA